MDERRKAKRMPISLSLDISSMYKQDNVKVSDLNAPIDVVNISQTGIGFITKSVLPVGYYFNANLNLGNDDTLRSVVKIIRSQPVEDGATAYGCEFVGMADVLSFIFDEYESKLSEE